MQTPWIHIQTRKTLPFSLELHVARPLLVHVIHKRKHRFATYPKHDPYAEKIVPKELCDFSMKIGYNSQKNLQWDSVVCVEMKYTLFL